MGVVFDNGHRTVSGAVDITGGTVNVRELSPETLKIDKGIPLLQQFNASLDEHKLNPLVLRKGANMNIHWMNVPDAAEYVVIVSKYIWGRLYFMAEYRVEHNKCFLTLSNLVDNGFIVQITAESREGNVIAKTRGILDQGRPQDW